MIKRTSSTGEATRRQIVEAALSVLKEEGFDAATSRTIARAGGFNPALIFYHFGGVDSLLVAALERTSLARLERWRSALAEAPTLPAALASARELYAEDRASGHVTVVAQMVAGSVARPELAPPVLAQMEPWLDLCQDVMERFLRDTPFAAVVAARELTYGVASLALGINMLTHLDPGRAHADGLLARLAELAPLLER